MKNTILPVVVLFKKRIEDSESINSLLSSDANGFIRDIFVYDNTPGGQEGMVSEYMGRNVIYIKDINNSGVSTAYNKGLRVSEDLNYKYILILDQDTTFTSSAMEIYIEQIKIYPDIKLFAPRLVTKNGQYCSPLKYKWHRGFNIGEIPAGIHSLSKLSPINSGMLINVRVALKSGGYDESVFLDFSDFQFIERFRRIEDKFCVLPLTIQQDFSNEDTNISNLAVRFSLYCKCARACFRENRFDDIVYWLMVFARSLKLTKRTKSIVFIKLFFTKYLRG